MIDKSNTKTYKPSTTTAGFTLIEVLVASGVLALAVGAVLQVTQVAVHNQDLSLERVQANQLITEASEIIHQVRDSATRDGVVNLAWDEGLPENGAVAAPVWSPTTRQWEFVSNHLDARVTDGIQLIELSGIEFRRRIQFSEPPVALAPLIDDSGDPASVAVAEHLRKVTIEVSWQSHGEEWVVTGETLIGNWQGI